MEIRQLRTFQVVGRFLSFNRAAEHLHYAPSTVSSQIKSLEEELEVPLFDRLGKKVVLTGAGNLLMQYSKKILALEDETKVQVSGWEEPQGMLTLRIPQTIGICLMPEVLRKFHEVFPKIALNVNSCALDSLKQEFTTGVTDLAFLIAEYVGSADLIVETLGFVQIIAVCSPTHPVSAMKSFTLHEFQDRPLLLPKYDCSYKMEFARELIESKVKAGPIIEMNSVEMIRRCVIGGMGIAILPEILVRGEIATGRLHVIPWPETAIDKAVMMVWHKDKWISPSLRAFMDAARTWIKPILDERN